MRAAGGALEPYWSVFAFHSRQDIVDTLADMKIGEVDPRDLVDGKVPADAIEDPFKDDPERDPRLIKRTEKPCNAETPQDQLGTFFTPNATFFTRNHLWVPQPKSNEWELSVELPDGETKVYTLADLKSKFKHHSITGMGAHWLTAGSVADIRSSYVAVQREQALPHDQEFPIK